MEHVSRGWVMAAFFLAETTNGKTMSDMAETMRTGLVPLFSAIGVGVLFMATLTVLAVIWLRPRLPQFET